MGLPTLLWLMSLQRGRQRRRRQTRARNGSTASVDKRKGSPCQQDEDGDSQAAKRMRYSVPTLPEDILCRIHSLLLLHDAARATCLSRGFLRSWRCHPNLTLNKDVLSSEDNFTLAHGENFSDTIDCIMRNHSGIGVKILKLELHGITCDNLDGWLQVAITPRIEELTLRLSELGRLRSLTRLYLQCVRITRDELECLLSNSLALVQLELCRCKEIVCLRMPSALQQLSSLRVVDC